jgi:hypothetical protein
MRAVLTLMILMISLQPLGVVADTGVDDRNRSDSEKRGILFVIIGTCLAVIGFKGGRRVWNDIDEYEEDDETGYYLYENLVKLSILLLILGVVLFIGGVFHIL